MTLIIAHRGASRLETENTIAAFERASSVGADGVELDVRRTADDALVVHHDPSLPDGRVLCRIERNAVPAMVPSFDDALDACTGMFVNIEIKNLRDEPDHDPGDRVARLVADRLRRRGGGPRWLVSSFRYATIELVAELIPEVRTAWLTTALHRDLVERTVAGGHDAIHPAVDSVDEGVLRLAHTSGLAVNAWTCNDVDRMRELIGWGIDGICTDVADVALAVRAQSQ